MDTAGWLQWNCKLSYLVFCGYKYESTTADSVGNVNSLFQRLQTLNLTKDIEVTVL